MKQLSSKNECKRQRFIQISKELIVVMAKGITGIIVIFLVAAITVAASLLCLPLVIYRHLKHLSTI